MWRRTAGRNTGLEEILEEVVQSTTILDIDEEGCIDYGDHSLDAGEVDRYQCVGCGFVLKINDDIVCDEDGLVAWLKEREMM